MHYTDRVGPILRKRFGLRGEALALSVSRVAELREREVVMPFSVADAGSGQLRFADHATPGRIICHGAGAGCDLCGDAERCVVFGADAP